MFIRPIRVTEQDVDLPKTRDGTQKSPGKKHTEKNNQSVVLVISSKVFFFFFSFKHNFNISHYICKNE